MMETKICCRCKEEKEFLFFSKDKNRKDGYYVICNDCRKLQREQNKEQISKKSKEYYLRIKEEKHDEITERNRKWRKNNPQYTTERKKRDKNFKLMKNIKSRFKRFLDIKNITKKNKTFDIIGCSPKELREHIEKQFSNEMNWENYGQFGWHVDHIIPLSSAKTEEEIYKLSHYTNLQPLWAQDNLKKGNKILNS
jgi:hypothetical protein